MPKIRVLIVDDSVVVRKIVSDVLSEDPEIEVAGIAANGNIALAKIPQVNPDVVTLDIEMPELNGLQTLAEIRKTYKKLPVIMFSTLTERGAASTLEALSLGASDYVTKPANVGSVNVAMQRIREDLVPKIKALCGRGLGSLRPAPPAGPPAKGAPPVSAAPAKTAVLPGGAVSTATRAGKLPRVEIVAIGVSTGGPNALAELMPVFPSDFPVPIVIVQHMPPFFTKLLAERLAAKSALKIQECVPGAVLKPGEAWIAPGDYHMVLEKNGNTVCLRTNQDPPENSCRPAVDVLFRSVVNIYGRNTLAAILTGMGQDGLIGCEHIRAANGQIVVQDENSSVVWGMPGFVARAGLAEKILPLGQIGQEIIRRVRESRAL